MSVPRAVQALFTNDADVDDDAADDEDDEEPTLGDDDTHAAGSNVYSVEQDTLTEWIKTRPEFTEFEDIPLVDERGVPVPDAVLNSQVCVVVNVVVAARCNMRLDLTLIQRETMHQGVVVLPRKFHNASMQHADPTCKTRVFPSGNIDCKGGNSVRASIEAIQHRVDGIAQIRDWNGRQLYKGLRCTRVAVQNMIGTVHLRHCVNLVALGRKPYVKYDRRTFNMAFFKLAQKDPARFGDSSAQVLVSEEGKVVVTGGKSRAELHDVFDASLDDMVAAAIRAPNTADARIMAERRTVAAANDVRERIAAGESVVRVRTAMPKTAASAKTASRTLALTAFGGDGAQGGGEVSRAVATAMRKEARRALSMVGTLEQEQRREDAVADRIDRVIEAQRALSAGETRTLFPIVQMDTATSLRLAATHHMEDE